MIAVPLPNLVVLPLALVVRDVGRPLPRLQRRLMSQMVKHRKRSDLDSKAIKGLDVHVEVEDVEVEGVEAEDVEVEGVEVGGVEVEDAVVNLNRDRAPVVDNKEAKEALVDMSMDKDVVDVALHIKLQVDKTSMLPIESMLRICNFLVLHV